MKIITRGVPPESKPVRLDCGNCSTVVECAPSEMSFTPDEQRASGYWMCACPVCGAAIVTSTLKPIEPAEPE